MKREEADFVRVSIDHFELPAQEISRLWALQEKYIDLLESKLRRASQQEQLMKAKLLNYKKELAEKMSQLDKLKVSCVSELGLSDDGWCVTSVGVRASRGKTSVNSPPAPPVF